MSDDKKQWVRVDDETSPFHLWEGWIDEELLGRCRIWSNGLRLTFAKFCLTAIQTPQAHVWTERMQ